MPVLYSIVGGGLLLWLLLASLPVRSRDVRIPYLALLSVVSVVGIAWSWGSLLAEDGGTHRLDMAVVLTLILLPGGLVSLVRLLATRP